MHRHKFQVTKFISVLFIFSFLGCSGVKQQPQDTFVSDVMRDARRIIYVSLTGNDKASGSRGSPLASIQKAIDIAQHDDVVRVEPGTYTENIKLRSHINLVGSGTEATIITAEDGNIITADNVFDVIIEGFTLDGKDSAQHGLFSNCEYIQRRSNSQSPTMIIFRKNVVKNLLGCGIYGEYSNITIEDNTIISLVGDGIYLFRSLSKIDSNNISLVTHGILLQDYRSSIEDNIIKDTRVNGIHCHNLRAAIKHNKIIGANRHGIRCEFASPVIRSNYITASSMNGIDCYGGEGNPSAPKIRGNIITKNRSQGVYVDKYSWPDLGRRDDIGNNSIYDNGKSAVYSESPRTIMAVSNWWGSPESDPNQFHGKIDYTESLSTEP